MDGIGENKVDNDYIESLKQCYVELLKESTMEKLFNEKDRVENLIKDVEINMLALINQELARRYSNI